MVFKLKQVFLGPNITKNVSSPSNMEHFTHFILEVAFQLLCRFKASYLRKGDLRKGDMNTKRKLYREAHTAPISAPSSLCPMYLDDLDESTDTVDYTIYFSVKI